MYTFKEQAMAYVFLGFAIALEVLATSLLGNTAGFTRLWPSLGCLACYGMAFYLLSRALQAGMQTGTGYALWSGLGTAAIVIIGLLFLGEPLTAAKAAGVLLIIGGVVVLNVSGAH
jgi:small multidrug resistance pump